MRRQVWQGLFLLYLAISVEALSVSTTITHMSSLKAVARGPNEEKLYSAVDNDRPGITKTEWAALGYNEEDFSKVEGKGVMPEHEFHKFASSIGKTPTTITLAEYPYLIQKFCSSPMWLETCVQLGPYTVIQSLVLILSVLFMAFTVRTNGLDGVIVPLQKAPTDETYKLWINRNSDSPATDKQVQDIKTAGIWKSAMQFGVLGFGLIIFEIFNLIANYTHQPIWNTQLNRKAWFAHLRQLKSQDILLKDSSTGDDIIDKAAMDQKEEINKRLGLDKLATSREEYEDMVNFPQSSGKQGAPNTLTGLSQLSAHVLASLIWTFLMIFFIGVFRYGMLSNRTWTGGVVIAVPVVFFLFIPFSLASCEAANISTCKMTSRILRNLGVGILSLLLIVLILILIFKRTVRATKFDPINQESGLGLPTQFDYDPRVETDVKERSVMLLLGWLMILVFGIFLVGTKKSGFMFGLGSTFASDPARLFTNVVVLIQDLYLFWHDPARYSNVRISTEPLLNTDLPAKYEQLITDILIIVHDVISLYPILYDYIGFAHKAKAEAMKRIDIFVVLVMLGLIWTRVKITKTDDNETAETGQKWNRNVFAFSCLLLLFTLVLTLAREELAGGAGINSTLFAFVLFGVIVYLYLLVSQNMDDPHRPVLSGHILSDLYMMRGVTGAFSLLQWILKISEPRWIFPKGTTTSFPIILNFILSLVGFHVSSMKGDKDAGMVNSMSFAASDDGSSDKAFDKESAIANLRKWASQSPPEMDVVKGLSEKHTYDAGKKREAEAAAKLKASHDV